MKYRFSAVGYRIIAYVLAAVCLAAGYLSAMTTVVCLGIDLYDDDWTYQTTGICKERAQDTVTSIVTTYQRNPDYDRWDRLLEDTSLRFLIVDEDTGDVKASYLDGLGMTAPKNLKDNIYMEEYNWYFELGEEGGPLEGVYVADWYFGSDWMAETSVYARQEWEQIHVDRVDQTMSDMSAASTEAVSEDFVSYQLLMLLPQTLTGHGTGDRIWEGYQICQTIRQYRVAAPVVLGISLVLGLACLVFLFCQAGHRPGQEELTVGWLERIPLEFPLAAGALAVICVLMMIGQGIDASNSTYMSLRDLSVVLGLFSLAAAASGTVLLGVLVSLAACFKRGQWWNSLLSWRILYWCAGKLKGLLLWLWDVTQRGFHAVGMVPRVALALVGGLLVEFLLILWIVNVWDPTGPLVLLILYNAGLLLALIWAAAQMKLLQTGAKALADGDLEHQVDTARMYWDFKQHGEYLNAVSGGMTKAVEKQMRSERLKTELITNVSHDIKTPLTSIVNYVDLLQKPHSEAEQTQYLEVLDRQAKRLKRLTENLVEASKASTGNMAVHLEPINVMELVNQAVEEYRDRMEAGRLETVVSLRGDLVVLADGKLMWRVLDNLLNNVIKYALAGTRVYVTAEKWEKRVVIAIKNISRDPLNVDADELMERFVRGDSSRHTEGSGLGLNIAKSLTQLQHGEFRLTVDGDLFKAEVSLPVAEQGIAVP